MSADPAAMSKTDANAVLDQAKRLHLAETLVEVSRTVAALDTLDEILASLVAMTAGALRAERATLFLDDPATHELYSRSMTEHGPREIRMRNDRGIAGRVFHTGEGMVVNDAYAHPDFNPEVDETTGYVTRQILCAPIRTGRGELIGVAQVLNRLDGDFERRRPAAARGDDVTGGAGPDERAARRAAAGAGGQGDGVRRPRGRHHLRDRSRCTAAASDGRGDGNARRRAVDAVPARHQVG